MSHRTTLKPIDGQDKLLKGDSLYSPSKKCQLIYQNDGNLVIYKLKSDGSKGDAVWSSQTQGRSTDVLQLRNDGNLVLYDAEGKVAWNSLTNGRVGSNFAMVLEDDIRMAIYRYIIMGVRVSTLMWTSSSTLECGRKMTPNTSLWSPNKRSEFRFQRDGNMVIYWHGPPGTNFPPAVIWASDTVRQRFTCLQIQDDGSFLAWDNGERNDDDEERSDDGEERSGPWNSSYHGVNHVQPWLRGSKFNQLLMQDDGNLVLYNWNGTGIVWSLGSHLTFAKYCRFEGTGNFNQMFQLIKAPPGGKLILNMKMSSPTVMFGQLDAIAGNDIQGTAKSGNWVEYIRAGMPFKIMAGETTQWYGWNLDNHKTIPGYYAYTPTNDATIKVALSGWARQMYLDIQ